MHALLHENSPFKVTKDDLRHIKNLIKKMNKKTIHFMKLNQINNIDLSYANENNKKKMKSQTFLSMHVGLFVHKKTSFP